MRIEINAVRLDLTDAIKGYVDEKIGSVSKMIKKFETRGEVVAFIEISRTLRHHRQGDVYYGEVTMKLPQKTIRIERTSDDVYGVVDALKDELKEEIGGLKESKRGLSEEE